MIFTATVQSSTVPVTNGIENERRMWMIIARNRKSERWLSRTLSRRNIHRSWREESVTWSHATKFWHTSISHYDVPLNTLLSSPSGIDRVVAPVARVWQWVQDRVASLLGSRDAWHLSKRVTGVWLWVLAAATAVWPPLAGAWAWLTAFGVGWIVENEVTKRIAASDGKR